MCFLNQWVQKRKRSVVSGSRQKPDSRAGGGRSRPGARCPQVRPSERGPGGRGKAARLQAPDRLHRPGRQTAPLTRGPGDGGRGARRELGIPSPPPPERLPQSAERPPDDAYKQGGAASAGTSDRGCPPRGPFPCSSYLTLLGFLLLHLLPRRQQAPTGPGAPGYSSQQRGVGDGTPTAHAHDTAQEGGGDCLSPIGPRC